MSLPKNIRPEYNTTLPSSGKRIKYQPFSVREEKILILAAESQDVDEVTNAITNILKSCITSPSDLKIEELPLFDIEFLFLKTRAKSAGETIKVNITDPDDETFTTECEIQIDKIKVEKNKDHKEIIELSDDVTIKMKYPDISFFNEGIQTEDISSTVKLMAKCVSQIISGEEVFTSADMTEEEITEWIEGLTTNQFKELSNFFSTMPKMSHSITTKNTNTGENFTIKLEGLADFF